MTELKWKRSAGWGVLLAAWCCTPSAIAQTAAEAEVSAVVPSAPDPQAAAAEYAIPSPDGLVMPKLDFTPTPTDDLDYDKYFYFHREGTSFAEAYTDIKECDALASGSSIYYDNTAGNAAAFANYGVLTGAIGSAIGSAVADAIFGSAERRKQRRVNLRNCMGFKQYQRFALNHALWEEFNFEEGNGRKKEGRRNQALALQALVASGSTPTTKELGL